MTKWIVECRAKHEIRGRFWDYAEIVSAWSPVDAATEAKEIVMDKIARADWVEALAITVRILSVSSMPSDEDKDSDATLIQSELQKVHRPRVSVWWNGFGFGIWRSVWPSGSVWSIAFGPVTFYVQEVGEKQKND